MGRLLDTGTFVLPYTISAIVYTVSILLTAQCKEYYRESLSFFLPFLTPVTDPLLRFSYQSSSSAKVCCKVSAPESCSVRR